ncbi:MAG: DUF5317 family protein [Dehalococcoidia bacterium]
MRRRATAARRGGAISHRKLAASALAALALAIVQFAVIRFSPWELAVRIAVPATIAAVPLALWPHRRWLGIWVIFVGLAANLGAVVANGGLMPIEGSSVAAAVGAPRAAGYAPGAWVRGSKDVLVTRESGRVVALGDSIVVRAGHRGIVASPGDVVILAGVLLLAGEASVAWQRARRPAPAARGAPSAREAAQGSATTPQ